MIDMIQNAKDLIQKGKDLNDPELIQMGMNLLEQYSPSGQVDIVPVLNTETVPASDGIENLKKINKGPQSKDRFLCENCGFEMEYDKPRKRCPECKKHKLIIVRSIPEENAKPLNIPLVNQFSTQIRNKPKQRLRVNEDGRVEGVYTRPEPVEGITNVWNDDLTEGMDEENERLKSLTKRSPRERPPFKKMEVKCENCGKIEKVHPLHAAGRARHLCIKCIGRGAKV